MTTTANRRAFLAAALALPLLPQLRERRLRWRQGNEWQERRYKLKRPELGF